MHVTTKGQVTIPREIREKFGFLPQTEVDFIEKNGTVFICKADSNRRGEQLIKRMRGKASVNMSTKEIMALTREG